MNLRQMTMDDADKMLEWKNYDETRKFAIASHDKIEKEAHYKWLEKNIQYFQIIVAESNQHDKTGMYGAVRIQDDEISIWIDKQYWGKGIATWVLELVSEVGMTAKIVDGNIASMRAFIRAGFLPKEYIAGYKRGDKTTFIEVDGYYIFQK